MKNKLYYQVLDTFDIAIDFYNKKIKTLIGCAIHEYKIGVRHQHLQDAEQYKERKNEIELARTDFINEYEPEEM